MDLRHPGAGLALHAPDRAGRLVDAPVVAARDEGRGHVDGAAREDLEFGIVLARGPHAVPVQAALEACARVLGAVDRQFPLGQPGVGRDFVRRGHFLRHRLGHALGEVHDVVGRHPRHLVGGPCLQFERLVALPVGALVVVVGAQECMQALRGLPHVLVRGPRRVVPLVMLARPGQGGQRGVDVAGFRRCRGVRRAERHRRRAAVRRAHQDHALEDVGTHQRGKRCHRGTEVVAHHRLGGVVAHREQDAERVAHQVEEAEGHEIAVVVGAPARGPAVAALVGRDRVVAGGGQRRQHLAPAVGQLGKAVQQQDGGAVGRFEPGLQHVDVEAIDAGQEAGADAGRQERGGERFHAATLRNDPRCD